MTSFAMTSFFKNKCYRGISKEYRGIFEKDRVFAKKTGFLKMTSFAMTSFFKNITGEFLKNTQQGLNKKPVRLKNDILFEKSIIYN